MSERARAVLLLLVLCAVETAFRSQVLLGVAALFQRDLDLLYFPLIQSMLREASAGALPVRDATSAFGQPLIADPSSQILYPPIWLHLFLSPSMAYGWFVSAHSVFGAMGVALLARRLSGGSASAAFFGGCAWLACGPLQSMATLWHHMSGAAWMPWILLAVERVLSRTPGNPGLLLGAAIGAQVLAGSADMCAMTLLVAAVRVVLSGGLGLWRTWAKSLAFGLTLGAGVWLPAGELVRASARSGIPETARTYWSAHPLSLVEFFFPVPLAALHLTPAWRQAIFEGREPFLASTFLGIVFFPLVLAALADPRLPRALRLTLFLSGTGAVLAALGKHAVFYSWLVAVVPPLKILRYPSKALIPAAVVFCVLAALGAASLRGSERSRRAATVGIVVMVGIALALGGPLLAPLTQTLIDPESPAGAAELLRNLPSDLLVSLLLLGLLYAFARVAGKAASRVCLILLLAGHVLQSRDLHQGMNPLVPAAALNYRPDYVDQVRPPTDGRLYVYDYWLFHGRAKKYLGDPARGSRGELEGLSEEAALVVATRGYLNPLSGASWGIEYAWDSDLRMLFDRRLAQLTVDLRRVEGTPAFLRLLQVSGVRHVLAMHEEGLEDLRPLFRRDFHPRPLRLFEVPDPLPRAFLVSGRMRGSGRDLLDLISPGFDPWHSVLVDKGPERPPSPGFEGTATVTLRRADRLRVETDSNAPAFLGLLEGSMPGWRAWIDGVPAEVERANAIFVGAEVPAGRHVVEFRFLPATVVAGTLMTAIAGLFLINDLVKTLRFRRDT